MASKKSISADLTEVFAALGKKLGFSDPIVHDRGWETHIFMIRNGHALQMEILWYGLVVFVHVVRLHNGRLPDGYVEYKNPDGSWGKISIYTIYHVKPEKHKKKRNLSLKTWDDMEPYYYRSLKELDLIRENPDVLLDFMDQIDSSPFNPPI